MIKGFRKLVSEPSIKTLEKIDAYIEHYKEVYKTNKTLKADKRLNLDRPISVTRELLSNFEKLEDDVKHLDEISAIDIVVSRIGRYPQVLLDDEKNESKKEIDAYENKFADKKTCKLINKARAIADNKRKASKEKIKQMKFKYSYPIATEEAENAMLDYAVMDEDKSKVFEGIDDLKGSELSEIRDALIKEKAKIIEKGKRYELFKRYSQGDDKKTHNERIEKSKGLSGKDEKALETIFGINIPSDIREQFDAKDLKVFEAYSKK